MSDAPTLQYRFPIPAGWTLDSSAGPPTLIGPEGDLRITFVELEPAATIQETALAAWKTADPAFDSKVSREASVPTSGGWESMYQIIYEVPAKDSRMEIAILRTFRSRAFVNLVRGSIAAISRRGAQLSEIFESWKPEGYGEISLKDAAAAPWTAELSLRLKEFLASAIRDLQIPGAAIAIVQGGKVAYADGFGTRTLGVDAPVTPQTRFMIGSTTKPLTTLLMAKLVDYHKLSWSTPVVDLLDGFALADPETTRLLEIRHTASASTGMPRQDMEFIFKYSGITPEDRIAEMRTMKPTTSFGETFQYSNYLVAAGGYAAARAYAPATPLEDAYQTALQDLVLDPLHMASTFLRQSDALPGDAALPHALAFDGKASSIPLLFEMFAYSVAPAGAVWSTVLDMSRYLMLELGNGRMPDGERVISEEALLERRKKGIKITEKSSYGLGLIVGEDSGIRVIHHGGNTLGFTADMFFLPDKDLGAVILTNLYTANLFLTAAREKIFELAFGAEAKAEKTVASAVQLTRDGVSILQKKVAIDPESMSWVEDFTGKYHCAELGFAEITRRPDCYWAQFDEWGSALGSEIQPSGDRLLRLLSPPWRGALRLLVDPNGRELLLDGGQQKYIFRVVGI